MVKNFWDWLDNLHMWQRITLTIILSPILLVFALLFLILITIFSVVSDILWKITNKKKLKEIKSK